MSKALLVEFLASGMLSATGQPLAGGKVYSYTAGTTTRKTLYTLPDKSANATNPVVLNSLGQATVFADGDYKFEVRNSNDVVVNTIDNVGYTAGTHKVFAAASVGGTGDAITIQTSPVTTALAAGDTFIFTVAANNTGAATLKVDSLAAVDIRLITGEALYPYALTEDRLATVTYSGAYFILENPNDLFMQTGLASAGSTVADATALTARISVVETLADTQGVVIPSAVTGKECIIVLRDELAGNVGIKVYPNTGDRIAEAAVGDPIVVNIIAGGTSSVLTYMSQVTLHLIAKDATTWQPVFISNASNSTSGSHGYSY